ncbi:molecular chaperone GrpE [Corynebacterium sp. 32222D000AT]|uniref:molecular chaperone GrpE n=1 Tax=unclassified Corynebacterium TaxID=2624378 RepID=UPI002A9EF9D8|nr:molecular chaperone GrpE [Mycobacteriaceae bacterium]MDY5829312.1 molecular chaperone GrpE [Corynebacterium sp.]
MMGQELFEQPHKQYEQYHLTAFPEESAALGDPEQFPDGEPTAEQAEIMEKLLEAHPDEALTFDAATGLWISGAEADVEALFSAREEFVAALEEGVDPEA